MQIINPSRVKMRVYERGVGETQACASGACAGAVYGVRLAKIDNNVTVELLGGELEISYYPQQAIKATGPAIFVFEGQIEIK